MARLIIFFLGTLFFIAGCNNNSHRRAVSNKKDSLHTEKHEDTHLTDFDSCYENFFKELPRFKDSGSAYLVWKTGKRKTLTQFFKDEFMSPVSQYGQKDINADGINELIIFNNTGGAHCCDEYYIFNQMNEHEFEYKAHVTGQLCIDAVTNTISYSLSETFGYFFTCYACGFSDSSSPFKTMHDMQLRYATSKLEVVTYDTATEKQNIINLEALKKHGYEKIEGLMDNGWRKEFAINLAIWHFNHGKKWKETKKLFHKYYTFKDASRVWKEFYKTMIATGRENSF